MNARTPIALALAALLAGCTPDERASIEMPPERADLDSLQEDFADLLYRVTASPSVRTDANGARRALPTLVRDVQLGDAVDIDLQVPFRLQGTLRGRGFTPALRATLPGSLGPVAGTLQVFSDTATSSWRTQTDSDGAFALDVSPGPAELSIVPDDASYAVERFAIDLDPDLPDLQLVTSAGVPVWGRVMTAGAPRVDAQVRLIADGHPGPTTWTDAGGWFELYATAGMQVAVQVAGDGSGVDPILTGEPTALGANGHRVDVEYPSIAPRTVSLRALRPSGQPERSLPYELRSVRVDGLPSSTTVSLNGFADTAGNIVMRLVPGFYALELLPQSGRPLSGQLVTFEVAGGADVDLGDVDLDGLQPLAGRVLDPNNVNLIGARVTCREEGLAQRSWSTDTIDNGVFSLDVPSTTLACTILPPHERTDLASLRFRTDAIDREDTRIFALHTGAPISGRVTLDGQPEALALVEVHDRNGNLVGTTLTDADGDYVIRVLP